MTDTKHNDGFPALMTESELVEFLRIPVVSNAKDHHNVVEKLKRFRNLPRIHLCNKALYPREAVEEWIRQQRTTGDQLGTIWKCGYNALGLHELGQLRKGGLE